MTSRIFRAILFCTLSVLLVSFIGLLAILYVFIQDTTRQELSVQTSLVQEITQIQEDQLENIDLEGYRISLFSPTGLLLYDSSGITGNPDHSDREEIQMAMETGRGQSQRWSDSLEENTIYEARKLEDGKILRLSVNHASLLGLFVQYLLLMVPFILAVIALSFFIARKLAVSIMDPVNAIDLEHPMQNKIYPQLRPLMEKLEENQNKIKSQAREFETVANNMEEALLMVSRDGTILSQNTTAKKLFAQETGTEVGHPILVQLFENRQPYIFCQNGQTYLARLSRVDKGQGGSAILVLDITDKMEAARRRQEFTDNVTHELKTPLQTILSSAELLTSKMVLPEDQDRFIQFILQEGFRMKEMIESILHLSSLEREQTLQKQWVSIRPLLERIIARTPNPLSVFVQMDLQTERLYTDPVALEDILSNLVSNGMKYNTPGGLLEIQVEGSRIVVKDTGTGIEEEDQSRIFERFYRGDKSRSSQIPGTGLGLAIVKHQADLLHAKISFRTGKEGTVFEILLDEKDAESPNIPL